MTSPNTIFTVGHSNHGFETFVALLRGAGITAVADVRSIPYSRHVPQFDREALQLDLRKAGIAYVFLGDELGARPKDPRAVVDGVADWGRMVESEAFRRGLDRVLEGARRYRIALLCAEKEPLDCHRTLLVARQLQLRGASIAHLLADGTVEPQERTERRLLERTGEVQIDLFAEDGDHDPLENAYARRGLEIAWREPPTGPAEEDF